MLVPFWGIDGRDVMRIACLDQQLNISQAYLRPGFAFGGSCLPKDVRALVRSGQLAAVETDIFSLDSAFQPRHFERVIPLIRSYDVNQIGLMGLSFKSGTDDLRESPLVLLAETLIGQGYDLRIHDPDVGLERLVGANQRYIDRHLPHLARYLCTLDQLIEHSQLLIFSGTRTPAGGSGEF